MSEEPIVNKVAKSGLIVLEMDQFVPKLEFVEFNLEPLLWEGMALKEKDFREFVSTHDWEQYRNKEVVVYCSADAIVPNWAYMLLASKLSQVTNTVFFGTPEDFRKHLVSAAIDRLDIEEYADQRVIVKGCGEAAIDHSAFGQIGLKLTPVVKTLMFGEPCSTVPVYKQK